MASSNPPSLLGVGERVGSRREETEEERLVAGWGLTLG
jgi:hypothetical protein